MLFIPSTNWRRPHTLGRAICFIHFTDPKIPPQTHSDLWLTKHLDIWIYIKLTHKPSHCELYFNIINFLVAVQLLSCVQLFATPWIAVCHNSQCHHLQSLLKLMSIESVMLSNLCTLLLLLPSIFPSIRVFSNESAICNRWSMFWSFSSDHRTERFHSFPNFEKGFSPVLWASCIRRLIQKNKDSLDCSPVLALWREGPA